MFRVHLFVLLLIAAAVHQSSSSTAEMEKMVLDAYDECLVILNIPAEEGKKLKEGNTADAIYDVKCAAKCMFQKLELMDSAGEIQMDKANELMQKDMDKLGKYAKCASVVDEDACTKAFTIITCLIDVAEGRA